MTVGQHIDYEALAQEAKLGIVRKVLARVMKSGLPGDHHFYIAFDTQAAGVSISKRLKEKYAQEMTIVLQHRFWGLQVDEKGFEVKLTFDGIPERLVVPFSAVKVFYDPSVPYGLQFDVADALDAGSEPDSDDLAVAGLREDAVPRAAPQRMAGPEQASPERVVSERSERRRDRPQRKTRIEAAAQAPAAVPTQEAGQGGATAVGAARTGLTDDKCARDARAVPAPASEGAGAASTATQPAATKVVSLDAFRKK